MCHQLRHDRGKTVLRLVGDGDDACPRCGGGLPWDEDNPDHVCHCGAEWADGK